MLNLPRRLFANWLQMRILMVGCSAGEGALDRDEPWVVEALHEALGIFARESKVSMVLLKDFHSIYRGRLDPFSKKNYCRAPSMPACKLELSFASFEEFVQEKLSYSFRKNLRRKFKKLAQHPPLELEVIADCSAVVDELYPLYQQTFQRSKLRFEELTRDFLIRIGREMPDRVRFFIWRQKGKAVAFALCMVHGDTIHDLNVGLDYAVALDLHLYFVTWRDVVTWALENGLKRYYTAPLNYDPKLHLRMELAPLDLYAWHTSPLINPFFRLALRYLQPARHDPIIRQFTNAHEL
jgi:predicted N-acyltransferase